ncbi:20045_t:CDS:2, partial [Racocetra fulgida]
QKSVSDQNTASSSDSKNFKSRKRFITPKQKPTSEQNTASSSAFKNFSTSKQKSISDQNTASSSASKHFKSRKRFITSKQKPTLEQNTASSSTFKNFSTTKFIPVNLTNKTWPTPVNYKGHFTNGKVWTEYLAELLNIKLINYAFGGATSNSDFIQGLTGPQAEFTVPGIRQQIEMFISANAKSTKKQRDFRNDYIFDMSVSPLEAVKSLMDALRFLLESLPTIKTILIPDMPDLSRSPAYNSKDAEEKKKISEIIETHNKSLLEDLIKLSRETGVRIIYLKFDKLLKELQTEDAMIFYGIINGKDAANNFYNQSYSNTSNEIGDEKNLFFFWDDYHVTTVVHEALANVSFEILENLNSPLFIGITLDDYAQ